MVPLEELPGKEVWHVIRKPSYQPHAADRSLTTHRGAIKGD
jgi:hypothetical protein